MVFSHVKATNPTCCDEVDFNFTCRCEVCCDRDMIRPEALRTGRASFFLPTGRWSLDAQVVLVPATAIVTLRRVQCPRYRSCVTCVAAKSCACVPPLRYPLCQKT
eukprot:47214-Eustigmatos_ZCMA.PRE.1